MSRKLVDRRWITARMDRRDARVTPRMLPAFLRPESVPYASVEVIRAPVSETSRTSETVEITGDPAAWHAFLAAPGTGAQLDQLMTDFAAIDQAEAEAAARLEADRDDDEPHGSTCGANCGFCGRCS